MLADPVVNSNPNRDTALDVISGSIVGCSPSSSFDSSTGSGTDHFSPLVTDFLWQRCYKREEDYEYLRKDA
ncbi:hypothetical protein EVAR_66475_1 [Eumeta japonica]|uniref:Uncharacterized protein n=1 Tax=Eumeta variegata TaxID=151549 RepID=A0A4C1ZY45_EUMVA|nr:hypothetical protein EVAR_66475_1 [Eumeta japonica]